MSSPGLSQVQVFCGSESVFRGMPVFGYTLDVFQRT